MKVRWRLPSESSGPAPVPPAEPPPARTVIAPGRGELFLRDTGGDGPVVMLLHGWMASADMNWHGSFSDLAHAGYRVLAIDHRGHGRGLRQLEPFRLTDCAADAAAALRVLRTGPATVVGYSMGGAIALLVARDHPDVVSGLVLSGTTAHWQDPRMRRAWKAMGALGLALSMAPRPTWKYGLALVGLPKSPLTVWLQAELMRHSARDLAEAGRELGRFDSRSWLASIRAPVAAVITTTDDAVPPGRQRELAAALDAQVFEVPINHLEITSRAHIYNPVLLSAIATVLPGGPAGDVPGEGADGAGEARRGGPPLSVPTT
ncbi:MAG: alpha/beta fold hydrolase [Solirubrobacteraceae bacterium]